MNEDESVEPQVVEEPQTITYMMFRFPDQEDLHFILRAWLTGYQPHGWAPMCKRELYYIEQQRLIGDIAARPNCRLIVATNHENTNQLYGFACGEPAIGEQSLPLIMHWVYVKQPFRRLGVAKAMLQQFGWQKNDTIVATHWSKHLYDNYRRMMKKHRITCNPYILMRSVKNTDPR